MALFPGYTLIGEFPDLNFVAVLETRFRAAGIEYVVLDEARASWSAWPVPAFHGYGARILVRDDHVESARLLLE